MPQPDGPRRLKNSPSWTSRSMWSTANASPNFLTTSTSRTSTRARALRLLASRGGPARPHDRIRADPRRATGRVAGDRAATDRSHAADGVNDANRAMSAARDCEFVARIGGQPALPELRAASAVRRRRSNRSARRRAGRGVRYRRTDRQNPDVAPEGPDPHAHPHRDRRHRRPAHRPGARAGRRPRDAANMVKDLAIDGTAVAFTIELTTPACPLKDEIESRRPAALTRWASSRST